MEIILKEDIERLGKAGDVINVKPGYARNYLIPRGLALLATPQAKALVELEKKRRAKEEEKKRIEAQKIAEKLVSVSCTITAKVGQDDQLYGSVTSADIAKALEAEGILVDKRQILLENPIRALGIYQVTIRLHPEITSAVKVWVVKE